MQEASLYQEVVQLGVKKGKCDIVLRQLSRRVSIVNPQLQARIQNLAIAQLDQLSEALLDFTNEADLVSWLDNQAWKEALHTQSTILPKKDAIALLAP